MAINRISRTVLASLESLLELSADQIVRGWSLAVAGRYRSWRIPKGDGRTRRIDSPPPDLKLVQQAMLEYVLYRAPVSPLAHGFMPARSIVTNAQVHQHTARAILSLDLEDAYPSVSRLRARRALEWGLGWFIKVSYPELTRPLRGELFEVLTDICCYKGCLPQGAPTSGMVLNLACAGLDRRCTRLVRTHEKDLPELRYSRYADDLTFTASQTIPQTFLEKALKLISASGFRANMRKIERYEQKDADLVICGVRIHDGQLTLPRKVLRRYRAMLFQALAYEPNNVPPEVRHYLRGALGFLTMVCPACPPSLEASFQALLQHHRPWLTAPRRPAARPALLPYQA
jgi:RNA-directed DNA polymerase